MIASEFLTAYPMNLNEQDIYQGAELDVVRQDHYYSFMHGNAVHAAMTQPHEELAPIVSDVLALQQQEPPFANAAAELHAIPDGWRNHRNDVNFSFINEPMVGMWGPLLHGGAWPNHGGRAPTFNFVSIAVAGVGFDEYLARQKFAEQATDADHNEVYTDTLSCYDETLSKMDAAIVTMEAIRKFPNITVVPAPLQFEKRADPETQADLLVIDTVDKQMVGVRVTNDGDKSSEEVYDTDRIVRIDTQSEFTGISGSRKRGGKGNSHGQTVDLRPGLIATAHIHNYKLHGSHRLMGTGNTKLLMQIKLQALRALGNVRIDMPGLATPIRERILSTLYKS